MSPRLTDWSLALAVGIAFASGILSLISGRPEDWLIFALHGAAGLWLALLLWGQAATACFRVWHSHSAGIGPHLPVPVRRCLWHWRSDRASAWVFGTELFIFGFNLMNWHILLGLGLTATVSLHMLARAKPLRARDMRDLGGSCCAGVPWRLAAWRSGLCSRGWGRNFSCPARVEGLLVRARRVAMPVMHFQPPAGLPISRSRSIRLHGDWRSVARSRMQWRLAMPICWPGRIRSRRRLIAPTAFIARSTGVARWSGDYWIKPVCCRMPAGSALSPSPATGGACP